jgi:PAS domain S-box-containing protein
MELPYQSIFQAFFNTTIPRVVLNADLPDFTIMACNDAYRKITHTEDNNITGKVLWEVYRPENAGDNGGRILLEALTQAVESNQTVNMPPFNYNIPGPDKGVEVNWWQLEIVPVGDGGGITSCLLITTNNITQQYVSQQNIAERKLREHQLSSALAYTNEELSASNEELIASLEELKHSQHSLQLLNDELENRVAARTKELWTSRALIEEQRNQLSNIVSQLPVGLCILSGKNMVLELVNDKMLQLWDRDRSVTDKTLLDFMPELKGQAFPQLLDNVYTTGISYGREDAVVELMIDGQLQNRYFDYSYIPLKNNINVVESILVLSADVTDRVISRLREQELTAELTAINEELSSANEELIQSQESLCAINNSLIESESRFREMVQRAPVALAVIRGRELIFESVNDMMLNLLKKTPVIIGKPYAEALPEMIEQPYYQLLKNAYTSSNLHKESEAKAILEYNGELLEGYFNYVYQPVKDENGITNAVMAVAIDVTDQVLSRQREQELNEELATMNEELSASNEELNAANEELSQSQSILQALNEDLTESETRFRNLVKQAPVGICIIRANDLVVIDVNDSYLELVGKKRAEMENRCIWDSIPEAAEAYKGVMDGVINTGITFIAREHELLLIRNGEPETVFVDFVYEPILLFDRSIDAIMVLGIDVTDKVIARRGAEEMEERIRLAVEAAEIGTFDLDLDNHIMLTSGRFDTIFGFDHQVSWEDVTSVIHPDDQAQRLAAHESSYKTGRLFYEARVIHNDASVHWIRVQGQVYYNNDKEPVRVLGTLLDITQFKHLQQQKDDFISIASHELKTPITSLKASLQLLEKMKDDPSPKVLSRLIEQSSKSMQKISALVEDLLNVSRASESQLKLKKTTFNIASMLNACCNHIRVAGKYTLTIRGDEQLQLYADEHAIDQVVVNLVNNAVKYAPESLEIYLIIEKEEDMAKISVKDNGPGIPADKQPRLFERYYQANSSGFQKSGLGLGLYISAEIIKRHGGNIGVESELGKGSIFWFTLPFS